jgi:hypothetical protein
MTREHAAKPPKAKIRSRVASRDPVTFARDVLGVELWERQRDILRAVMAHPRVAVRACHASGKSFAAAVLALYWLLAHRDGKVLITGPSYEQTKHVIFGELARMIYSARLKLPVDANQAEIKVNAGNFILLVNQSTPERIQGFHSAAVLVIVDEAPSLEGDIWTAIQSLMSGGKSRVLLLGNPTVASGPFFDAFGRNAALWKTFAIGWRETPNFQGIASIDALLGLPPADLERDPVPMLLTRRFVADAWAEWWNGSAESSPLWQSRVEGEFPSESENALLSLAWIEKARQTAANAPESSSLRLTAGIDVAGPGDDLTVLTLVDEAGAIVTQKAWSVADPRGPVVATLNGYRERLGTVVVDSAGIGYGFGLSLRDQGFAVNLTNVGSAAHESDRFVNLKAEAYWWMREQFKAGRISGVNDDTASQLSGIRYELTPAGKIQIEGKDSLRKRGVKSPDRAESLMLALSASMRSDSIQRLANTYRELAATPALALTDAQAARDRNYQAQGGLLLNPGIDRSARMPARTCAVCERDIGAEIYQNFTQANGMGFAHVECARRALYGG